MFVDSHCHLEMESYQADREDIIRKCVDEGMEYILTVGTEESYFAGVIDLVDRHPFIYGAIGIHPHNATDLCERTEDIIRQTVKHDKIVGYGEVGLDFFKDHSPRDTQKKVFARQLALAGELDLPVIIHSRDAKDETVEILKSECKAGRGVIHCFSYDRSAARQFLDMGFFISVPGTVTYKNAGGLREAVRYIPHERLLAETDAPFLTPVPHRGKRNLPWYVKITIAAIAGELNIKMEKMAEILRDNFVRLFLNK
ncbi:MAG: sec-independent protein translocase protein [Deltaproteobacteria bacterium]|nr:sec-independent protein translocase protein [Deltaproteobacteria bacterium]